MAVGLPLVAWAWGRFPLSRLLAWLLVVHALILIYGGAHTYALTPLGLWFQEAFDLARNHYDRLAHFAVGFVPAILVRDPLLRLTPLRRRGGWSTCFSPSRCSFGALVELIEWGVVQLWGG